MKEIALKLEGVSKKYSIGKEKDGSLRGSLSSVFKKSSTKTEEFWALKDVSFEVEKGDVVGIIGKNGAGKSTLLKILSQITRPTEGRIEINGRIASLLEVGTGFHPELTGRENIFLNGTILGMTRKEVAAKFDEIVAFSGIEKFIDTPVKHYSSGMYVRLAFAVAAHLEPEILIIDEVLAVGDAEFQKKCLGKMKDVAGEGRTVLFVSHNLGAVSTLCNKGIVLEKGVNTFSGDAKNAIAFYMDNSIKNNNCEYYENIKIPELFELKTIRAFNKSSENFDLIVDNLPIIVETEIIFTSPNPERYHLTYHISNEMGEVMFSTGSNRFFVNSQINKAQFEIPSMFFQSGKYSLNMLVIEDQKRGVFYSNDLFTLTIVNGEKELGAYLGREPGYIRPNFNWFNQLSS